MSTMTTKDGTEIDCEDRGAGPPVVFSHGWPLNAELRRRLSDRKPQGWQDAFSEDLGRRRGRRGHGRHQALSTDEVRAQAGPVAVRIPQPRLRADPNGWARPTLSLSVCPAR